MTLALVLFSLMQFNHNECCYRNRNGIFFLPVAYLLSHSTDTKERSFQTRIYLEHEMIYANIKGVFYITDVETKPKT